MRAAKPKVLIPVFPGTNCEYDSARAMADAGADAETFSCLFCYCPLYTLGDGCGGRFVYTEQGIKDCSGCLIPHRRENYGLITEKLEAVVRLAAKKSEETAGSEKI